MINWPSGPASIEDHGRPAVDKLLVRRNSGLTLQGLDLRVGPSGAFETGLAKLAIGAGLD